MELESVDNFKYIYMNIGEYKMIIVKIFACKTCGTNIELYYNSELRKYIGTCYNCETENEMNAYGDEDKVMNHEV